MYLFAIPQAYCSTVMTQPWCAVYPSLFLPGWALMNKTWLAGTFQRFILSVQLKAVVCAFLWLLYVHTCFYFTFNPVSQKSIALLQAVATDQESFRFSESSRRLSSVTSFNQHVLSLVDVAHSAMEEQWELPPLPLPSEMQLMWGGWGPGLNLIWWSVSDPSWCPADHFLKSINRNTQLNTYWM